MWVLQDRAQERECSIKIIRLYREIQFNRNIDEGVVYLLDLDSVLCSAVRGGSDGEAEPTLRVLVYYDVLFF